MSKIEAHTSSSISLLRVRRVGMSVMRCSSNCMPPISRMWAAFSSSDCGTLLSPLTSSSAAGRFSDASNLSPHEQLFVAKDNGKTLNYRSLHFIHVIVKIT